MIDLIRFSSNVFMPVYVTSSALSFLRDWTDTSSFNEQLVQLVSHLGIEAYFKELYLSPVRLATSSTKQFWLLRGWSDVQAALGGGTVPVFAHNLDTTYFVPPDFVDNYSLKLEPNEHGQAFWEDDEMFGQAMAEASRILGPHGITGAGVEPYVKAAFLRASLREMAMMMNRAVNALRQAPQGSAAAAGFANTINTLMRTIDIAKTQMQALEAAHGPHISRPPTVMVAVLAEEA